MKMKLLCLLLIAFLLGCTEMTPEQIGDMKKRCAENGMKGVLVINLWTYEVVDVVCREKE